MSLLKTGQCFTNELGLPANKNVIAATFVDCNGDALVPNTQLARCVDIPAPQALSIAGNTLSLSGGGSVTLPDSDAQALSIAGNTLSLTNGGSVTLPAVPFATPAQTAAGTSTTLAVNPADLYARENIAAQTGVSNDMSTIPAPTAGQSNWAVNLLGETLHYAPGLGWQIVANQYSAVVKQGANINLPYQTLVTLMMLVAPRDGTILITGSCTIGATDGSMSTSGGHILVNGAFVGLLGSETPSSILVNQVQYREFSGALGSYLVTAGDVITVAAVAAFIAPATAAAMTGAEHLAITYTK
jgi:hypothetical protein